MHAVTDDWVVVIILKDDDFEAWIGRNHDQSGITETSIVSESRRVNISLDLTDGLVVT